MPKENASPGLMQVLSGAVRGLCPHCYKSHAFHGLVRMHAKCPACGYVYEREPGYFLGAMVVSYMLGAFSVVPTLLTGIFLWELTMPEIIGIATLQLAILAPLLFRYSRLIWVHVDHRADPAANAPQRAK